MDISLLFLTKPLDKHGITLVHITYLPLDLRVLLHGVFPDKLKITEVIALHKKGAADNLSNYWPTSLLSAFSQIFDEKNHT